MYVAVQVSSLERVRATARGECIITVVEAAECSSGREEVGLTCHVGIRVVEVDDLSRIQ